MLATLAIWRGFLAAHFGRASTNDKRACSAAKLLNAFEMGPYWTWRRVSENAIEFRRWPSDREAELQTLGYGNHRKYESKRPDQIWEVIESFVNLARAYGGPAGLMVLDSTSANQDRFDVLYRRLKPIKRFGRTGRYDFLVLLLDLRLISAVPVPYYLRRATGPRKGAVKLRGKRPIGQLDYLAMELAQRLGVSPMALEDVLCNWQK